MWICVYAVWVHVYSNFFMSAFMCACAYICMCTIMCAHVHVCCGLNEKCLHQVQVLNFWSPTGSWNFRSWGLAGKYKFRGEAYNDIPVPAPWHSLAASWPWWGQQSLPHITIPMMLCFFMNAESIEPRTIYWKVWRIEPK